VQSYPVASIDLSALKHNLSRIKELAPTSRVMSVVKANAYGHGYAQVVQALIDSDAFAVARLSEGIRLRELGIKQPIVILEGVMSSDALQLTADYSLSLVFHNLTQIELVNSIQLNTPLKFCWLMVETGMHRLGLAVDKIGEAMQLLSASSNLTDKPGLMSHFASAELTNDPRNQKQLELLKQCADKYNTPISMANSAAIISISDSHGDWIRPGLMLYGVSPFDNRTASDLGLKPVMQLKSVVIAVQELQTGDQVGYGGDWTASQYTRVGIVSIGYGDGYNRQLSDVGSVIIGHKSVPVLGRVSMDMIAIDLTDISGSSLGDEVCLWGNDMLAVEDVAQQAGTIPYELLCQISERVVREYHHG